MTTFADDTMHLQVVCDPCKRHGIGHGGECTCNVVTLPAVQPTLPAVEPDAFTLAQEERDRIARANNEMGDACRRWTTCGHDDCGWTSPEREYYWQIDRDEDDHSAFGCAHRTEPEPWDDNPDLWPYPEPHPWRHRMEPTRERIHVHRPGSLAYVSTRTPAAMPRRAA